MNVDRRCINCGSVLEYDDTFCSECGARNLRVDHLHDMSEVARPHAPPVQSGAGKPRSHVVAIIAAVVCVAAFVAVGVGYGVFTYMRGYDGAIVSETANEAERRITSSIDPSSCEYVPCRGTVRVITDGLQVLNVRAMPAQKEPVLMQVPHDSTLFVDGWWRDLTNEDTPNMWFRVTDEGGYVLGWVSEVHCAPNVDYFGLLEGSYGMSSESRRGSDVRRKHDPARYDVISQKGRVQVKSFVNELNVRPAPGSVEDVVFIMSPENTGLPTDGWSYDQFDKGSDAIWLRLVDHRNNVVGWVDSQYCNIYTD